jgi:sterol desaturase/sphingolipid hydroxylase (fatty acid hydroxylase superfamily)
LWAFHKVHHSASVLTPFTANRHHPVDYLIHSGFAFMMGSIAMVLFSRYHGVKIDSITLFNTSAIHFFYYMSANFRHSHIWLSFGVLNKVLVSPAMHQIHHSIAPRHHHRNFGFVFSIWDWCFQTRYLPVRQESIVVGLSDSERGYNGFLDALLRPFADSVNVLKDRAVPYGGGEG